MIKSWILSVLSVILTVFLCVVLLIHSREDAEYDCRASFVMSNYGLKMPVLATIRTHDHTGLIFYGGPVYRDEKLIGYLNRQVDFTIDDERGAVHMQSTEMHKFSKDTLPQNEAEKILPDFFVKPGSAIYLDTVHYKNGTFFIKDNFPMFWCKNFR